MTTLPYIKWYGAAWRSDPLLRLCSAAARGVWADCLSLMIEAEPYGHLAINGRAVTAEQFGSLTSTPVRVVKAAWDELESNGVWTRAESGIVYSRRLVRDKAKLDQAREHGKAGGNPNLKGNDNPPVNQKDNPTLNPTDNPIRQTIDDRGKTIEGRKKDAPPNGSAGNGSLAGTLSLIPRTWKPDAETRQFAELKCIPKAVFLLEAEKFLDHHIGRGTMMADPDALFRKWLNSRGQFGSPDESAKPKKAVYIP